MKQKYGVLIWDDTEGCGYVEFAPEFRRGNPIVCLDAISDWATGLTHEYDDHLTRSQEKFSAIRRKARRVSKKT